MSLAPEYSFSCILNRDYRVLRTTRFGHQDKKPNGPQNGETSFKKEASAEPKRAIDPVEACKTFQVALRISVPPYPYHLLPFLFGPS
jgi:hypothetical protein